MYQFKFYYYDGTTGQTNVKCNRPEDLYNEFDGVLSEEQFENIIKLKLSTHEILLFAYVLFREEESAYYKIEIINDETNEVIDYIEIM